MFSLTRGSNGTIRSLLPLPLTRRKSLWVMSPTFRARASEIRKPHPYNIVKMAVSLSPCQSWFFSDFFRRLKVCVTSRALGRIFGRRGLTITEISSFFKIFERFNHLKKFRKVEISRAREFLSIWRAARALKKARKPWTSREARSCLSAARFR